MELIAPFPAPASALGKHHDNVRPSKVAKGERPSTEAVSAPQWAGPQRRQGTWLAVIALHIGVAWVLAHGMARDAHKPKPEPLQVRLIEPPPAQPQRSEPAREIKLPLIAPVPLVPPPPVTIEQPLVAVAMNEPPPPVVLTKSAAAPAPATPAPPARAAEGPRQLPPSAIRYLTVPQLHVPRMSRRLGESGTVVLRILVDAEGLLKAARVKTSSGFDRLDEQALIDIRSARFAPYLDNGRPIEWEADAGLEYQVADGDGDRHARHR